MKKITEKTQIIGISIIALVVVALLISYSSIEFQKKKSYKQQLNNKYENDFHIAVGAIDDINKSLNKLGLASDSYQDTLLYVQIYKQAQVANNALSALPYNSETVMSTMKFLAQTSDISYSLITKNIYGIKMSSYDKNNIQILKEYCNNLSDELNQTIIVADVNGGIQWEKIPLYNTTTSGEDMQKVASYGLLGTVQKQFENYPTLLYDGPFSEHTIYEKPLLLENKEYITKEEALEKVYDYYGRDNIYKAEFISETAQNVQTNIPVYSFGVKTVDYINDYNSYIDISIQGGEVVWLLTENKTLDIDKTIDTNELVRIGQDFLNDRGYGILEPSYYDIYEDVITVNYCAVRDKILLYNDLIKVNINTKTGEVIGVEALSYVNMHHDREIKAPKIDAVDALGSINKDFKISSTKLALVPTSLQEELLTYQFIGKIGDTEYIIYVDAYNGNVVNIFELIKSPYGVLVE